MNNGYYLRLLKDEQRLWTSGAVIDFLGMGDDAEQITRWANETFMSEEFMGLREDYKLQIVSKVVARLDAIDKEAAAKLAKMWKVQAALANNKQNGIGKEKLNPNDSEHRDQAQAFADYYDNERIPAAPPLYGQSKENKSILNNETNLLKFIANTNVLPTNLFEQLNGIYYNTLGNEESITQAINNFHFFKKVQNLTDFSGENVGERIVASLSADALSMYFMIDNQLQHYSPDDMLGLMKSVRERIDFEKRATKDNNMENLLIGKYLLIHQQYGIICVLVLMKLEKMQYGNQKQDFIS